jgi:ectoine hydroxylase-related dioxygenase (phytanoyl-CoA dioxygenase family)
MINLQDFDRDGYAVIHGLLSPSETAAARGAAAAVYAEQPSAKAGVRDPLGRHPTLRRIADAPAVRAIAAAVLGPKAKIVRAILFDKTPDANWDVVWHQDVTIAVEARHDVAGFGPWSSKGGVPHVQPPAAVLERMATVRLHLDDCGTGNGPLLVVRGSHRGGISDVRSLDPTACDAAAHACAAPAGSAVVMRPLTLHASRKAITPAHRRVLHLEFAADELPPPLRWRLTA